MVLNRLFESAHLNQLILQPLESESEFTPNFLELKGPVCVCLCVLDGGGVIRVILWAFYKVDFTHPNLFENQ